MQIQVFKNKSFGKIRVIGDSENPLFCLKDVCENLDIQNHKDIKKSLSREFGKGVDLIYPLQTNGRIQQITFITEPQLYFILMRSDKPKTKPFRQWVVNESIAEAIFLA